jgi:phosphoglycolate/pyridoxal phosphate phosphatase family enzyme
LYSSDDRSSDQSGGAPLGRAHQAVVADRYDAFLFDLDGVLYRGADPVPGAAEALARLRAAGKRVAFVTNNASATPAAVARRLNTAGVEAGEDEIETSALATAALLAGRGVTNAFVLGEEGIRDALAKVGIRVVNAEGGGAGDGVEVVVIGLDRSADYDKLRSAAMLVDAGAALIATNPDGSFPAPGGARWPGAGALVAAVEATTDVRAEVVGKPNAPIFRAALERAGGGEPLVVGDRIDTDIVGASALGWHSLLVLTGISTREEAERSATPPTYVGVDLRALFEPAG